MAWDVLFHPAFRAEFSAMPEAVQDALVTRIGMLRETGPKLGRPHVDTLAGTKHANLKELRFDADNGAWRVAFAFDPARKAIVLVAGDKSGVAERKFYAKLVSKAEARFDEHLAALAEKERRS